MLPDSRHSIDQELSNFVLHRADRLDPCPRAEMVSYGDTFEKYFFCLMRELTLSALNAMVN
jgi:hypothetical protein